MKENSKCFAINVRLVVQFLCLQDHLNTRTTTSKVGGFSFSDWLLSVILFSTLLNYSLQVQEKRHISKSVIIIK